MLMQCECQLPMAIAETATMRAVGQQHHTVDALWQRQAADHP
jgi:hypothetical protein